VVTRFRTYEIEIDPVGDAYSDAVWNLPQMIAWCEAAATETIVISQFEYEPGGSI
jgi:glutathione S-transferase